MNKRKAWFWIIAGVALLIVVVFVGGMGLLGRLPWQSGDIYEDQLGRFTMQVDPSWEQVETDERYAKGQYPSSKIDGLIAQLNEYRGLGQEDLILQKGETFATLDDFRPLPPWGGLLSTPSDLTHFLQMHMHGGRYGDNQILKPETIIAMQEMQQAKDGSPLGFRLSWSIGEDEFGDVYYHAGGGPTIETTMRFYPDLDLGLVVMGSVNGYQADRIAEGLVST